MKDLLPFFQILADIHTVSDLEDNVGFWDEFQYLELLFTQPICDRLTFDIPPVVFAVMEII